MTPLKIPFGDGFAVIPLGAPLEDFQMLKDTLELWKEKIVKPEPVIDFEI